MNKAMEFLREGSDQEQDILNQRTIEKIKTYVERGLTIAEASDLVTWENAENQGGTLSPQEAEKKKSYLDKLQKYAP